MMLPTLRGGAVGASVLAFVIGVIACGNSESSPPEPTASVATSTPAGPTTPFVDVCQPNPDPARPEQVRIDQPKAGETLSIPATISGTIVGSENRFRVWIFDPLGHTLAGATLTNGESGTPRSFSETLDYFSEETAACVWVFELTADSSPIHIAQVPVSLPPLVE